MPVPHGHSGQDTSMVILNTEPELLPPFPRVRLLPLEKSDCSILDDLKGYLPPFLAIASFVLFHIPGSRMASMKSWPFDVRRYTLGFSSQIYP